MSPVFIGEDLSKIPSSWNVQQVAVKNPEWNGTTDRFVGWDSTRVTNVVVLQQASGVFEAELARTGLINIGLLLWVTAS